MKIGLSNAAVERIQSRINTQEAFWEVEESLALIIEP